MSRCPEQSATADGSSYESCAWLAHTERWEDRARVIGLDLPVVQAPMAGGPSTPSLAAAVSSVGGLGFLAAGNKTPEAVLADITATRELTQQPFGVNVFAPSGGPADRDMVDRYADGYRAGRQRCWWASPGLIWLRLRGLR
jgi:Nitronate monooxygenase